MSKSKTPSFILELPLATSQEDEREMCIRLEASRQVYNAVLGESLRRLDLMRESRDWNLARAMKKGENRTFLFKVICERFGFSEYSISLFLTKLRNNYKYLQDYVGSTDAQKLLKRAFTAVQQYSFGLKGKPRFKRYKGLNSTEGKSNSSGIRWNSNRVLWNGLKLPAIFDLKDKSGYQAIALQCRVKYCRILRKIIKGKYRWYVQLVLEGTPPTKDRAIGNEVVGIDIGPKKLAIVSETTAVLRNFCNTVTPMRKVSRRTQRAMSRSQKAMNPENYEANGTVKKGSNKWVKSKKYKNLQSQHAEQERCLAAERKRSHGELANQILATGNRIHTENVSCKSFQKNYGKAVGVSAPAMLIEIIRQKAIASGGYVYKFSTYTTKLSQTCQCGRIKKKVGKDYPIHLCPCGVGPIQRDLYSAFLAIFVHQVLNSSGKPVDTLDAIKADEAWSGVEALLVKAVSSFNQSAKVTSNTGNRAPKGFRVDRFKKRTVELVNEVLDGVAVSRGINESQEELTNEVLRIPRL